MTNNQETSIPYFENQKKFQSLTYNSEVPVGLQHHIFVEIFLRRIK